MKRYYLPSSGLNPNISPSYSNIWNKTSDADRLFCYTGKTFTPNLIKDSYKSIPSGGICLTRQYITNDSLNVDQYITGTVSAQVRCHENSPHADFMKAFVVNLVDYTGGFKANLYSGISTGLDGTEFSSRNYTNRTFAKSGILNVFSGTYGDKFTFEIGLVCFNFTGGAVATGQHVFGDGNTLDLPVDNGDTSDKNCWVEFSHNFI